MRLVTSTLFLLATAGASVAQQSASPGAGQAAAVFLPDAPSHQRLVASVAAAPASDAAYSSSSAPDVYDYSLYPEGMQQDTSQSPKQTDKPKKNNPLLGDAVDANGNPIPLSRQQPKRILGFMPNYRTVSAGAAVHPPGWKYNFSVATRQAFDYSSFLFLGLTSISAEGINSHPVLGKGIGGFYAYTWRGFLDKTDGTYLGAFLLPSALREDTRYYPLGDGHSIFIRSLYVISRQGVARDYTGHNIFNMAGLGGKVLTQYISRFYYPTGATDLSVLATKFAYAAMRDIAFSSIREFYPDIAAHYIRKHREKVAALAHTTANQSTTPPATPLSPRPQP